ncbi:hypothetical protein ITJ86_05165 [Winogradskyella sp. F6397]|uniref:histidine kinase n=1 Tax=Winogradskyella marina TaxID=2785530 RepID=A0ABS0EFU4_9FLAO|nr:hypothetical protein [Winogradskyella marina]MBF8149274.1 hypothetical protein [Winogradskyella marina]
MKLISTSFLFFWFYIGLFLLVSQKKAFGQTYLDSISHYSNLVLQPQNAEDLFKAEDFFKIHYKKAVATDNTNETIYYLYYLASIKLKQGAYDSSEDSAVKGLKIIDGIEPTPFVLGTRKSFYNLLGILYNEERNKEKALELYNETLKMAKTTADSAIVYNNISIVHKNYKDTISAKTELLKAFHLIPRIKDTLTHAMILDNLGVLLKNDSTGLPLLKKSLALRELKQDSSKLFISHAHLAEHFNSVGDTFQSKQYALKALNFAKNLGSASYKNRALGLLTAISDDHYARSFKRLNDSLQKVEQEATNKYAMIRYDVSKKEAELQDAKKLKERIVIVFVFIVLVIVFIHIYQRFKHKKETLLEVYETEHRISKRIHDEVANDLFHVMTKLEHQDHIGEDLKSELHSLYHKTRDISKEHDLINSDRPFIFNVEELLESFNDAETNIIVKGLSNMTWDSVSELRKTTLYKVLQELLINMRKHSEASIVVIVFNKTHKKIHVSYSDNGIGTVLKKGSGLQNTENRIEAINGTITFESEPNQGFKSKITV